MLFRSLMADYREGLVERNPKWLQDDYAKFIRMAQHLVEQAGSGIVAFVTNHSYMFNPTFRAMRRSLMSTFQKLYLLDLGGNSKIQPKSAGSECDENVFNVKVGIGIALMVKTSDAPECEINYAEIRGTRRAKLDALAEMTMASAPWQESGARYPHFIFRAGSAELQDEYYSFPSVPDYFDVKSVGFVTSRDAFAVDVDRDALLSRISDLRNESISFD